MMVRDEPSTLDADAWNRLCETLRRAGRFAFGEGVPDSPRDRAEGVRYLTRFLAAGIGVCVEHADPDHPEFGRMIDRGETWGLDCPDCLYLYATVRGDATYRIHGNRGSANHFDVQVNHGHFASGDIAAWGTIASTSGLELDVDDEGEFELVLSPERQPGNWLPLAPNAEFVLVRQYFDDWENERPADLLIERIGAPVSSPPPTPAQMTARLERLGTWLDRGGALWQSMSRGLLSMPPNSLILHAPAPSGAHAGMRDQAYGMGNFVCGPDDAVVVEFAPPACRHWSVSLASWTWESIDFATRQSSLNGHQATLDVDGVFRGVIAQRDPGVPNWLDPAAHERGSLAIRFLRSDDPPKPTIEAIPFARLREVLPADTARVDPAARERALERRRSAAIRRYRR